MGKLPPGEEEATNSLRMKSQTLKEVNPTNHRCGEKRTRVTIDIDLRPKFLRRRGTRRGRDTS